MTVRMPNGTAIQYNDANYATRSPNGYTDIYTRKDGKWIAQVPNGWLIEVERPCRVYDPLRDEAASVASELRAIKARLPKRRRKERAK